MFGLELGFGFSRMRGNSVPAFEGPKREKWRESDGLYYCVPVQAFVQLWELGGLAFCFVRSRRGKALV